MFPTVIKFSPPFAGGENNLLGYIGDNRLAVLVEQGRKPSAVAVPVPEIADACGCINNDLCARIECRLLMNYNESVSHSQPQTSS